MTTYTFDYEYDISMYKNYLIYYIMLINNLISNAKD